MARLWKPLSVTARNALLVCIVPSVLFQLRIMSMVTKPSTAGTACSFSSSQPSTKPLPSQPNRQPVENRPFTVDIVSVGSLRRIDYLEAQLETFGQHLSVRNFWGVTEHDDVDQSCHEKLTWNMVKSVSRYCGGYRFRNRLSDTFFKITVSYASENFLAKKSNPIGWMCAQRRPMQGVYKKALKQYIDGSVTIPDYLLIMDDDTYVDMTMFEDYFSGGGNNTNQATATAGCRIMIAFSRTNFSFPFGGFGYYLSKSAIQRLIEPVHCRLEDSSLQSPACEQIRKDMFQEARVFKNGMSVGEMLYEYTVTDPYTSRNNWTHGFCMHSDWVWGMLNFYNISDLPSDNTESRPQFRLGAYKGSGLYSGNLNLPGKRFCDLENSNCHSNAPVCHYSNPTRMRILTDMVRSRSPHRFRSTEISSIPKHTDSVFDMIVSTEFQREIYDEKVIVRNVWLSSPTTNRTSCKLMLNDRKRRCSWNRRSMAPDCRGHFLQTFIDAARKYSAKTTPMPDYLVLLMDKSTYYNVDAIHGHLKFVSIERTNRNNTNPALAFTICADIKTEAFKSNTGLIVNRRVLERMSRPIHCKGKQNDTSACERIQMNRFGEDDLFQEGMSLLDILEMQLNPKSDVQLSRGHCMSSTRLLSGYVNYFDPVSNITVDMEDIPEKDTIPKTNTLQPLTDFALCRNFNGIHCPPESLACYGLEEPVMKAYSSGGVESETAWKRVLSEYTNNK